MISIYKTIESSNGPKLKDIEAIEAGCWVNIIDPSHEELLSISEKTNVAMELLRAALDDEETSRIDIDENNNISLLLDIPFSEMENSALIYDTYPLALIHTKDLLITVCLKESKILLDFTDGKVKSFFTFKRSRFILQILHRIASYYLIYLRQIDKRSLMIEKKLHKSMKNKELIQLLSLEKSLVYFSTSLKSNEITLEKMLKLEIMQKYPEDQDVLEDVIIENKQAIEMANIYSNILSGTMDAFASVISNNLNIVMKFLASVTIIMSIPNMISGMFGMNVRDIPFADSPFGFWIVFALIITISALITIVLNKKDMF
ncbi:magnesium transporter CorA family protein [Clostridium sp. MSJ-11]|uniref:Magnesium transporter CorA family protein n=1 Tax=Clostridium mobile TaxID=2841512 RepID=A0ABS6EM00_9CLOT|nr:magnesium transporter CorA family protein [Clostridium mobile]MBU5486248.1 magnesium transporter CorA family protein [Clostridium mobile]